jgi:hypothetical protein
MTGILYGVLASLLAVSCVQKEQETGAETENAAVMNYMEGLSDRMRGFGCAMTFNPLSLVGIGDKCGTEAINKALGNPPVQSQADYNQGGVAATIASIPFLAKALEGSFMNLLVLTMPGPDDIVLLNTANGVRTVVMANREVSLLASHSPGTVDPKWLDSSGNLKSADLEALSPKVNPTGTTYGNCSQCTREGFRILTNAEVAPKALPARNLKSALKPFQMYHYGNRNVVEVAREVMKPGEVGAIGTGSPGNASDHIANLVRTPKGEVWLVDFQRGVVTKDAGRINALFPPGKQLSLIGRVKKYHNPPSR